MKNILVKVGLLILVVFVISNTVKAQAYLGFGSNLSEHFRERRDLNDDAQIEGSHYLNDEWKEGKINYLGKNYLVKDFKYDLYNGVLLFKLKDIVYEIPDNSNITTFSIGDKNFINIKHGKKFEKDFLEILINTGNIKLYKKHICQFLPGKEGNGIVPTKNDSYRYRKEYFTQVNSKIPVKFSPSKRNIYKMIPDSKNEIKSYIKKNRLKVKKESDLIKVISFVNK